MNENVNVQTKLVALHESLVVSRVAKFFRSFQILISILVVQLIATGLYLLSRIVLSKGTFIFALITYRHIVAAICMTPFAIILERRSWHQITGLAWFWMFINSITGIICAMGLYYYGLRDTNATYATSLLNLIPIVTFAISAALGMEKLKLSTNAGRIKVTGAIICVVGALVISLYKGPGIFIDHLDLSTHVGLVIAKAHWVRGSLFLAGCCLSYSVWFIFQVVLYRECPLRYTTTTVTCLMASVQGFVIGICLDRTKDAWNLSCDIQLVTVIFSGALATAATFSLVSYIVATKGPTYPPMFNPISLIFTTLIEALFLGGKVTLGVLLGMSLIIIGLYSFLWGQNKEVANVASSLPVVKFQSTLQNFTCEPETKNPTMDNAVLEQTSEGK